MKLKKQAPTANFVDLRQVQQPNELEKQDLPGFTHSSAHMKEILTDLSTSYQDTVNQRVGKGNRQNSPDSPLYRKNKPFRVNVTK